MRVTYTVEKDDVLNEVRRLTHYIGSRKTTGADGIYENVSATESDSDMMEQFWKAACSAATDELKHFSKRVDAEEDSDYEVVMEMSSLYDTNMNESIEDSLKNFFINIITSKWLNVASPDIAKTYAEEALGYMSDVDKKMYHRVRPKRGRNI